MHSIFGTDGIRGRFDKEINFSLAYKVGFALGSILKKNNRIQLIVRDVRKYFNQKLKIKYSKLIIAPKAKIYNDAKDQRPSLIRKNKKTFSILAGKIDVAPIIFEKLLKRLNLKI